MTLGAHRRVLAGPFQDQLLVIEVGYHDVFRAGMDGLLSQGLHYREHRFGLCIIGPMVLEPELNNGPAPNAKDARTTANVDAVILETGRGPGGDECGRSL